MVVTDDTDLAAKVRDFQASCAWPSESLVSGYLLKLVVYHFQTDPYLHRYVRILHKRLGRPNPLPRPASKVELQGLRPENYEQRLSNSQAAIGLRQLKRLQSNLDHRRAVAQAYEARLSQNGMKLVQPPEKAEPVYVRYPLWVKDRGATYLVAAPHAVLGIWFSSILEDSVSPASGDYVEGSCPTAEAITKHLVNLPTHLRVTPSDIEAIVTAVQKANSLSNGEDKPPA
jgi:dTDP-4-amino-4,6-dideoxygalactose transaminase